MAKTNALILGGGMVGSVMAADLARDPEFSVTIADRSREALDRAARSSSAHVETIVGDLSDLAEVNRLAADYDIVLGALASAIGFQTLQAVIEAGKPYCDISFMPENALDLDALAKERNVTAIVDCGVAPGMSNLLAGFGAAQLDSCDSIEIYVGGVPLEPKPPHLYKAAFSPADVIEEYTRPARFVEGSVIVTREALSEPEMIDFPGVGALEAFNTDGLRSIMFTMNAPNMKEKTLRWPGHIALMKSFREAGFFEKAPVCVPVRHGGTAEVRPLDLTSALLFPKWTYEDGEIDLTVMRVLVTGKRGGRAAKLQWDLHDQRDVQTGFTSMARTTAFPCTILARKLARGEIDCGAGVIVPEMLGGNSSLVQHVLAELAKRGVAFTVTERAED